MSKHTYDRLAYRLIQRASYLVGTTRARVRSRASLCSEAAAVVLQLYVVLPDTCVATQLDAALQLGIVAEAFNHF